MSGNQPLVFERDTGGAGTHALIIASGGFRSWPSLDLRLPLRSGGAVANWLISRFHNPVAPLASLDFLASAPTDVPAEFVPPQQTAPVSLETPFWSSVTEAVKRWRARLDSHPDNHAFFYFVGCGEREPHTTLLLHDFLDSQAKLNGRVADFASLPAAMRGSAARRQVYFVEQIPPDFGTLRPSFRVEPLAEAELPSPTGPTRVVGYAQTLPSQKSGPSLFSSALLGALDRLAQRGPVTARAATEEAIRAINQLIDVPTGQMSVEATADFDFHFPRPAATEEAPEEAHAPDGPEPAMLDDDPDFPGHRAESSFAPATKAAPAPEPAQSEGADPGPAAETEDVPSGPPRRVPPPTAKAVARERRKRAVGGSVAAAPTGSGAMGIGPAPDIPDPTKDDLPETVIFPEGDQAEGGEGAPGEEAEATPPVPPEIEAQATVIAPEEEAEQVETAFVADDAELDRDDLGRAVPAISLARRLHAIWRRSNVTDGPGTASDDDSDRAAFVVHLDAPWGGGKTTFANFLARVLNPYPAGASKPARFLAQRYGEADLGGVFLEDPTTDAERLTALGRLSDDARRPWIVVPFNAWRVEHIAPPWWVFFQSIRTACFGAILSEGDRPWHPADGGRRRSSLLRRFGRWLDLWVREFAWRLSNPKIRALLLTALFSLALLGLLIWTGSWGVTRDEGGSKASLILANPLGLVLTGIGSITGLWALAALFTESIVPGSDTLAERLSLGSGDPFERFRRHFRRTMRRLRRPVMVVVDDLDRCRPDFVVDLIRGIQTLLRSPRVVFVILGDRDWIERAYEAHHQAMSKVDVGPEQSFGARFVEKAIQMSLILPALGEDKRLGYVRRVLLGDKADNTGKPARLAPAATADYSKAELAKAEVEAAAKVREIANRIAAEPEMSPFASAPIVEKLHAELQNVELGAGAAPGLRETLDNFATPERREQIQQLVNETLATRVATDEGAEDTIVHDLQHFAGFFPANPRQIKRIVNAITLYYSIALARQAPDSELEDDFRTQLAMWVIIMTEWPQTWRLLASFPALVDILTAEDPDQAMRMPGLPLPGSVAATRKAIAAIRADSDLMALITGRGLAQPHEPLTSEQVERLAELTPLHSRKRRLPEIEAVDGQAPAARRRWPPLRRL